MEQIYMQRDGKTIYCEFTLPERGSAPYPVVILSHGIGSTHAVNDTYARTLNAHGFATASFDFCGGGPGSQSSGTMLEMSVLTEADDLQAVMDAVMARPDFDARRIFLMGSSQGGFVSSYVAGKRPRDVRGLILLYPAYVLQAGLRNAGEVDIDALPETFDIGGLIVGRKYILDAASFDIYVEMAAYTGLVLILHGEADKVVPLVFSERAKETYANAKLKVLPGAGHGFRGTDEETAAEEIVAFLNLLPAGEPGDH